MTSTFVKPLMKNLRPILFISLILLLAGQGYSQRRFVGRVTAVLDGKTVVIEMESGKLTAEMQYIEVPVPEHPLYKMVRDHLEQMVLGKYVEFQMQGFSSVKMTGQIYLRDVYVAQQMLRDGAAQHVPSGQSTQGQQAVAVYEYNQEQAKNEKRGIWADDNLTPLGQRLDAKISKNKGSAANGDGSQTALDGSTKRATNRKSGRWASKNPNLGNVGALLNGYDPETKTGYLSTSLLGLTMSPDELAADVKLAIDVTCFYKEDDRKGRKSVFILTLVSASKKLQFLTNNDLWVIGGGKSISLGKPKRTVSKDGDYVLERLQYEVGKSTLDRIINNDAVFMKSGSHIVYLTGLRYMLYNMLQIAQ